jgi:hypothetical protein
MSFMKRRVTNPLKRWVSDYTSMYVLFGLIIINLSLYYLYYSLRSFFSEGLIFLFKITGKEAFPSFGFYLSVLPPVIASCAIHFLGEKISRNILKVVIIFMIIILALALTLTFIPLSITIFVAYTALAGVSACISFIRSVIEELKPPLTDDKENKRVVLEMRHNLLITMLAYSVWAIITIILSGLSVLFFNPAIKEMIGLGGWRWTFVQGQSILCIGLTVYYVFGFVTGVIINIFKKILEIEEIADFSLVKES